MDEAFIGTYFGKFFLLEKIAEGGMGEIFLAKERGIAGFEKIVAVKRILPEFSRSSRFIQMFQDEAILAGKINHPNIVYTNELGEIEGTFYISMEYIHGEHLDAFLRPPAPRMPLRHALYIAISVLTALDYAHNLRYGDDLYLIHRDIKPKNLLVTYEGGVKIIDFGISKNLQRKFATQPDTVKGTPEYMSPEQIAGEGEIDHRCDLFSFGIVLWEMLTGERLFEAPSFKETCSAVLHRPILPPSRFNPNVSEDLDEVVLRALARDREARYADAAAFRDALQQIRNERGFASGAIELAAYLRQHFGARIAEAEARLERFKGLTLPLPSEKGSTISTVDFPSRGETKRRRWWKGAYPYLLLLLIVGLALGWAFPLVYDRDARLDISSVPEGALVYLDGQRIGTTPLSRFEVAPNAIYELRVVKRGYRPERRLLQPGPGDRLRIPFRLEAFASLTLSSEPTGAALHLDGKALDLRTPVTLDQIDPTLPHTVELSLEGHLPWTGVFHFQPGQHREFTAHLTPIPPVAAAVPEPKRPSRPPAGSRRKGGEPRGARPSPARSVESLDKRAFVTIRTEPPGATVTIDGKRLDRNTPIEAWPLSPGREHEIALALPGFERFVERLHPRAGEALHIEHPFRKLRYGQLVVDSQPWTTVFLDGEKLDTTPVFRKKIRAGKHTLRLVNRAVGLDEEIPITIEAERLNKIAPRFEGFLSVHPDRRAEVFIDGKRIGVTPIERFPIVIGNHEMKLKFVDPAGEMTLPLRIRLGETTRFTEETIR